MKTLIIALIALLTCSLAQAADLGVSGRRVETFEAQGKPISIGPILDVLIQSEVRRGVIVQEPDGGAPVRRFRIPMPSLASNSNSTPISSSAFWISLIVLS
jgi:hypothetical protein